MTRIIFYATKTDILNITNYVESKISLTYYLESIFFFTDEYGLIAPTYASAQDIANIGFASGKQTITCERYIIANATEPLLLQSKKFNNKMISYYESGNAPDSVLFTPAGLRPNPFIIEGILEQWSNSPNAKMIMNKFYYKMKKEFRKIMGCWVGPEAYELLVSGYKLTMNEESHPDFYLNPTES